MRDTVPRREAASRADEWKRDVPTRDQHHDTVPAVTVFVCAAAFVVCHAAWRAHHAGAGLYPCETPPDWAALATIAIILLCTLATGPGVTARPDAADGPDEAHLHSAEPALRLSDIADAIRKLAEAGAPPNDIIQACCDALVATELCDGAWIGMLDSDGHLVGTGLADPTTSLGTIPDVLGGLPWPSQFDRLISEGRPAPIDDANGEDFGALVVPEPYQAVMCPLLMNGRVYGVLAFSPRPEHCSEDGVSAAGTLAHAAMGACIYVEQAMTTETTQNLRDLSDALKISESNYRELVESARSIIVRMDLSGRITFMSPYAGEFFGYTTEEIIGRHVVGTIIPDTDADGRDLRTMVDALCRDPAAYAQNENENVTRDGRRVWISWANRPLYDAQGQPMEVLCVGTDVTAPRNEARTQTDLAQRVQRQQAALVHLATDEAILSGDLAPAFAAITQASAEATGFTRVGVWLLENAAATLRCRDQFDLWTGEHSSGATFTAADCPAHFSSLKSGNAIDALDAATDPRTGELAASYLIPEGTASLLDATVRLHGEVIGVVRCEHAGAPRDWQPDERLFSMAIADQVTRVLLNAERASAQDALLQSERRFRATFEQAAVGVCHVSTDRRFLRVNQKLCDILGYDGADIMRMNVSDITHPEDCGPDVTQFERLLAGELPAYTLEKRYVRSDGTPVWIQATVSAVLDDGGHAEYAIVIVQDVTARKHAEHTLKLTKGAVDAAAMAITWTDADGLFTYVNEAACRSLGYSADEMIGMHGGDIDPDFPLPDWEEKMTALREDGLVRFEARHRRKDGGVFPVEVTITRVVVGGIEGSFNFIRDLTEQKRTEQALRESDERHRNTLNMMQAGVVVVDAAGTITFANSIAEEMLARVPGVGHCFEKWLESERLREDGSIMPESEYPIVRVLRTGDELRNVTVGLRDPGSDGTRWMLTSVFPVCDDTGALKEALLTFVDITDRRKAEQELRDSEARFRSLSETASEGIIVHDQGRIVDLNDAFARMLGYDTSELVGVDPFLLAAPESRPQMHQNVSSKHKEPYEIIGIRRDGSRFPVELEARNMPFMGREARVVYVRDITQRKQAEQALRESEERYRILAENSTDVIWLMRTDGTFEYISPSAERLMGYSSEEALSMHFADIMTPASAAVAREALAASARRIASGDTEAHARTLELEMVRKDGSTVSTEVTSTFIPGDDTRPAHVLGVTRDISERINADRERRRLATAVEQSADAVVIANAQGEIQYANPAAETISGYARSELVGRDLRNFAGDADVPELDVRAWDAAGQSGVWTGHLLQYRKDGSEYEIEATISPVRDAAGALTHYVLTARDVTEQAELERRLRHTQKMEAIGTLAGGVAHDFNNMLTAIAGYAELMEEEANSEEQVRHAASVIARAAHQATELTEKLLGFARKGKLQNVAFDVRPTIDEVIALLSRTIDRRITIRRVLDADVAAVQGDPTQIQQVLLNLGINARDAMPEGGTLTFATRMVAASSEAVGTRGEKAAENYLAVSVSDTGLGIPDEVRGRLFEPFFTTKPEGEGTGMGLAMAYGIIQAHGGWIDVETEVGSGTTFTLYLPAPDTSPVRRVERPRTRPVSRQTGRILIVDDEEIVREILNDMLTRLGYEVVVAATGQEAVALYAAASGTIDAVIVDLIMPGMDGAQTFDALRAIDPGVRALLSTGNSPDGLTQELLDRGMLELVPKPYRMEDISRAVSAALAR